MKKHFNIVIFAIFILISCKDNFAPEAPIDVVEDQMQIAASPGANIYLDRSQGDAVALTFDWNEAHSRGAGTTISYHFRLTKIGGTSVQMIDSASIPQRSISFTHNQLNELLTELGALEGAEVTLKAQVAAEVSGATQTLLPELTTTNLSITTYPSITGPRINDEHFVAIEGSDDMRVELTFTQNTLISIEGFPNLEQWFINPDFVDNTGRFIALTGKYRITAVAASKYFRIEVMDGDNLASLNADGTGAIWVLGPGIGNPLVKDGLVDWNADRSICLAPIGNKKYQLTGAVGERFRIDGTNWDLKFMVAKSSWTSIKHHLHTGDSQAKFSADLTANPYIHINSGDDLKLKYLGAIAPGTTVRLILDASQGVGNIKLSIESLNSAPAFPATINGTPMTPIDLAGFLATANVEFTQASPVVIGGIDPASLADWFIDPDFIDLQTGVPIFVPVSGKYRVIANVKEKYLRFYMLNAAGTEAATLQPDGTGTIWIQGDGIGKPSIALGQPGWGCPNDNSICMANIGGGIFRTTLTAGQQINIGSTNFKFFFQPCWGGECIGGATDLGAGKVHLENLNADLVDLSNDGNITAFKGVAGAKYTITIDANGFPAQFTLAVQER